MDVDNGLRRTIAEDRNARNGWIDVDLITQQDVQINRQANGWPDGNVGYETT